MFNPNTRPNIGNASGMNIGPSPRNRTIWQSNGNAAFIDPGNSKWKANKQQATGQMTQRCNVET